MSSLMNILQLLNIFHSNVAYGFLIHLAHGMEGNLVKETNRNIYIISPEQISISCLCDI